MYDLWLSALHLLGSRKQNALLEYFETAKNIFDAPLRELEHLSWLTEYNIRTIKSFGHHEIEDLIACMEKASIKFLPREHPNFPTLLRMIPDSPVGVFILGEFPQSEYAVALVGSRRCSEYGLSSTRLLSKPLARRGVTIVSGMARGIDSMAHKGAIEGGGKTVAVLGCGVDICYPSENHALRADIILNGCLLSEYPPGTKPMPAHFPARNRIISGLSSIVVVVEAAKKSGTLITVDQAHDQGREVMAVPGNITSKMSEGTNGLIHEGAAPVTGHEDILLALGISIKEASAQQICLPDTSALAPDEKVVYDSLTFDPVSFDELALMTGLQPHAIHYACTMLEIKSCLKKLPGMRYIRNIH